MFSELNIARLSLEIVQNPAEPALSRRHHRVHLAQLRQQRDEALARAVTHKTDLNPVAVPQVLALVAEEKTGGLELIADFLRADRCGQRQGDDRRRRMRIRREDVKTQFAQFGTQPDRKFLYFREGLL